MNRAVQLVRHWFAPEEGPQDAHIARWIFLRALGLIYFSAFYSLVFQIRGLIGPEGILPVSEYLASVTRNLGPLRFWFAPTLLWFSCSSHMLMALCWVGIAASLLVVLNIWPRAALVICFVCFLSFVAAAGDFSGYQSDGMLLEAGFIALFFTPGGFFPGWGRASLAPRASLFLLQWERFRFYFKPCSLRFTPIYQVSRAVSKEMWTPARATFKVGALSGPPLTGACWMARPRAPVASLLYSGLSEYTT